MLAELHCVSEKRDQNVFLYCLLQSSSDSGEMWYIVSRINVPQNPVNVFDVTWIMSLHYLVKLEMLIAHVLPSGCYRKKLPNLSYLNCGLQIHQIWIQFITECGKYCKKRCTKHVSLLWTYRQRHWRMAAVVTTWSSLAHSVLIAVSVRPNQWSVLYIYLLVQYPHAL